MRGELKSRLRKYGHVMFGNQTMFGERQRVVAVAVNRASTGLCGTTLFLGWCLPHDTDSDWKISKVVTA
jgi:hypothetical protein